jgi:hypothetical protein
VLNRQREANDAGHCSCCHALAWRTFLAQFKSHTSSMLVLSLTAANRIKET